MTRKMDMLDIVSTNVATYIWQHLLNWLRHQGMCAKYVLRLKTFATITIRIELLSL
jgi:hypothetical protein